MRILYRDDLVLVADKPAGLLTVPGRGDTSTPLSALVRELAPDALPVHRLDRDTSGAVVFALTRAAHRALNAVFEGRRVEKTYLALCLGAVPSQTIDLPLCPARRSGMRVAENHEKGALPARTEVAPKERYGAPGSGEPASRCASLTLCELRPRTGRTHQLRVHLAAVGHPLLVDPRYGQGGGHDRPVTAGELWAGAPDPAQTVLARTPLHASALRLPHPSGKGWLQVESPLPEDFARCLELLRAARRAS